MPKKGMGSAEHVLAVMEVDHGLQLALVKRESASHYEEVLLQLFQEE